MKYLLFTTQTCPKCPAVKDYVTSNVTIEGEFIDNTHPEFMALAGSHGVTQAPTFIVLDGDNEVFRGNEVPEIESFFSA